MFFFISLSSIVFSSFFLFFLSSFSSSLLIFSSLNLSVYHIPASYTFSRINTWNVCPGGYFLSGLYRNNRRYLNGIIQAKCCKSTDRPALYQNCYDEDVTNNFDHNDEGMKTCQRPGYYMTGFFKSNCNFLYCIEKFKCCSPSGTFLFYKF